MYIKLDYNICRVFIKENVIHYSSIQIIYKTFLYCEFVSKSILINNYHMHSCVLILKGLQFYKLIGGCLYQQLKGLV